MKKNRLRTPVLFLVFNRLNTTKKVFAEIQKAKPKQLFIASDGPREDRPGEKETVEKVRKYILDNIDWPCKVKTLFRKENLGCKYAVSEAISWFFKNVEQGIILEDDCLPNQDFFRFCQELLIKYKKDKKIMMISGNNFIGGFKNEDGSYTLSRYSHIWGWATWRRVWKEYNVDLNNKELESSKEFKLNFLERSVFRRRLFSAVKKNYTWDYQLQYLAYRDSLLCIVPKENMVRNIGFVDEATNMKPNKIDRRFLDINLQSTQFPLKHPKRVEENLDYSKKVFLNDIKRGILRKIWSW